MSQSANPKDSNTVARRKQAQQDRSQKRVEKVLETTMLMLNEGPAEDITTRKIATRANVSVGTIYQFFPNKEAIYYELFRRWLNQTLEALDGLIAGIPENSGPEDVSAHADAFIKVMADPQLNSSANWRLRLAMSSSHKLTELENRHRGEIAQRLFLMRSRFGNLPPAEIAEEIFVLQNEVTIACLFTLSRTRAENRTKIEELCKSLITNIFRFGDWA